MAACSIAAVTLASKLLRRNLLHMWLRYTLLVYTPSLGNRSLRCSNSCIPAVVPLPLFKGEGMPPVGR